ncbi:MAG: GreA/GreB family elongation factor [Planctomycetota bacterium]|jgi:transcription elongation factor GreA
MPIAVNYLTAEEKARLEEQLQALKGKRKTLSDRIGKARELGDISENAEYHSAKEDQGHNERKIRDLEKQLASAVVVDDQDRPDGMVFIGATVRLRNVSSGEEDVYRLVGESTGAVGGDVEYIEVTPNSPMGLALLKAEVGSTIRVDLPRGEKRFEIVEIV